MRSAGFIISSLLCVFFVWALDRPWGSVPALGSFLSPQQGFWQNAESVGQLAEETISIPGLSGKVDVFLDDRLVPHIFAQNELDAMFVQGYLHARYRLWQMEFQTHAAAGRLSEILGEGENQRILLYDRQMRRLGMAYAAKKAEAEVQKDSVTRSISASYTAGVNAFIGQLTMASLPLEYKLLGYRPEPWTSYKSALFLKYMSYDLAGGEDDFEMTNAKSVLPKDILEAIYPIAPDSLDPVAGKNNPIDSPYVKLAMPSTVDSLYLSSRDNVQIERHRPDRYNGSNNWAVNGTKTASGRPILCNDPHLSLNMPSLWFEMQISTPSYNAYGATFPGSPCVIIGFNDSSAFGFTNAMRDVRDYYTITFKDASRAEYLFNGNWMPSVFQYDTFRLKSGKLFIDTVVYTHIGPVMYDRSYRGLATTVADGKDYAVRWKAHDPSNEMKFFYLMDRAQNYDDYYEALQYLTCPGQNCLFATKSGTIALWQQAVFPAKWRRQGDFIMPGTDSSFMWQGYIPMKENPHMIDPPRGFVSSANQLPADTTYPYYIGGFHDVYRGKIINRYLSQMSNITPDQMKQMQIDNYNVMAEFALHVMLKNLDVASLEEEEKKMAETVARWNRRSDAGEEGPTIFNVWFDSLEREVWLDEFSRIPQPWDWPDQFTLVEGLLRDSTSYRFIDNIQTVEKETLGMVVTRAFKKAMPALFELEKNGKLPWARFKDAGIQHLLRLEALSRFHLLTGGGKNIINATSKFAGPSWRMIVHLTDATEAYGIYPGGQSGNPGSPYYDMFVNDWAIGNYYPLWVMKKNQRNDKRILGSLLFKPEKG